MLINLLSSRLDTRRYEGLKTLEFHKSDSIKLTHRDDAFAFIRIMAFTMSRLDALVEYIQDRSSIRRMISDPYADRGWKHQQPRIKARGRPSFGSFDPRRVLLAPVSIDLVSLRFLVNWERREGAFIVIPGQNPLSGREEKNI